MPRVTLGMGIGDWVARKIRRAGYSQDKIGKKLGISQQALSLKITRNNFSYDDLKEIFSVVEASDTEIIKVMRGFI